MSRQATISGTVTDASGAPLENAEVYLFREDLAGSGGIVVATTTDSDGNYQFISHPDQTGNVEDWHLGYRYNASDDKFFASNWGVSSPLGAESNFAVAIDSTTSPVAPGGTLDVTTTVTETGGLLDTQTITLSVNNGVGTPDTRTVSLPPGNNDTITLSWSVPNNQAERDYTATVASEDDTASQTVTVGGATLPSSAVHRWQLDDVASGTVTDSIGSADGTVNGVSSVSGTYQGGSAGDGDGTDDYIDTPTSSFFSNFHTDHAIGLTLDLASVPGSFAMPIGAVISNPNFGFDFQEIRLSLNNTGEINYVLARQGNNSAISTSGTPLTTGKQRVLINKPSNTPSDWELYYDGSTVATTVRNSTYSGSQPDVSGNIFIHASNVTGSADRFVDGIIDDVIFYDSDLTASEASDDYNIQPWS